MKLHLGNLAVRDVPLRGGGKTRGGLTHDFALTRQCNNYFTSVL